MAEYTKSFNASVDELLLYYRYYYSRNLDSGTKFGPHIDGTREPKTVTFNTSAYKNLKIKKIVFSLPIKKRTDIWGGQLANMTHVSYKITCGDKTKEGNAWDLTSITFNNVNLSNISSISLRLTPEDEGFEVDYNGWRYWGSYVYAYYGQIQATITYEYTPLSITPEYPLSGTVLKRSASNKFSWAVSGSTSELTECTFYWKYSDASSWTAISLSATATSYTFNALALNNGNINWYVKIKDSTGTTNKTATQTVTVGITPAVNLISPVNGTRIKQSANNTLSWDTINIDGSITSQTLYYYRRYDSTIRTVSISTSAKSYTFQAGTLESDEYYWTVQVVDSAGNSVYPSWATFNVGIAPTVKLLSPVMELIPRSKANKFTWNVTINDSALYQQVFHWSYVGSVGTSITLPANVREYTLPANSIPTDVNRISWTIFAESTSGDHFVTEWVDVGVTPYVTPSYPNGINIISTQQQIFSWAIDEDIEVGQRSYSLRYRMYGESNWTTITETTANRYKEFPANTFDTGRYEWQIQVTNNDGITSAWSQGTFVSIGSTTAPVIDSVDNSAIFGCTWTVASQELFSIMIDGTGNNGDIIHYESGEIIDRENQEYSNNMWILPDGTYTMMLNVMDEYGFRLEPATYGFVISTDKPDKPDIYAYATQNHSINISAFLNPDTPPSSSLYYYVMRRLKDDKAWETLGRIEYNETYEDINFRMNTSYEYCIRCLLNDGESGFTDSDIISYSLSVPGILLSTHGDFVILKKSESEIMGITQAYNVDGSFNYFSGRKFPLKEVADYVRHDIAISCYVTRDQYEKLRDWCENANNIDLYYRDTFDSFLCSIDSLEISNTIVDDGFTINVTIKRVSDFNLL